MKPLEVAVAARDKGASGRGTQLAACMRDRGNHTLGGCPDSDTYAENGAGFTEYLIVWDSGGGGGK
jgi:uncharacterized membrane protein